LKPATEVLSSGRILPASVKRITYAENQAEYISLPCVKLPNGDVLTRWTLTKAERRLIADSQEFWLCVKTFNQPLQPLMPFADEPDIAENEKGELFFYSPMDWRREQGAVMSDPEEIAPGFRDCIYSHTQIVFSFWDKVKILFGWKVKLDLETFTENRSGNVRSDSRIRVYREGKAGNGYGEAQAAPVEEKAGE
jgi:hypothetical protein